MKLVRTNSDDWALSSNISWVPWLALGDQAQTIFFMEVLDFECILPFENYIVVKLVAESRSCEFGSGELGQRAKVNAVDCLRDKDDNKQQPDGRGDIILDAR